MGTPIAASASLRPARHKVVLKQKAPQAATGNVGKTWGARLGGLSEQRREPINVIEAETAPRMGRTIPQVNLDHRERIESLLLELGDHLVVSGNSIKGDLLLQKPKLRAVAIRAGRYG